MQWQSAANKWIKGLVSKELVCFGFFNWVDEIDWPRMEIEKLAFCSDDQLLYLPRMFILPFQLC